MFNPYVICGERRGRHLVNLEKPWRRIRAAAKLDDVRLHGTLEVSCAAADIGTGTYTILTQIGAEMLGLPMDKVTVKIGDSDLPFE